MADFIFGDTGANHTLSTGRKEAIRDLAHSASIFWGLSERRRTFIGDIRKAAFLSELAQLIGSFRLEKRRVKYMGSVTAYT